MPPPCKPRSSAHSPPERATAGAGLWTKCDKRFTDYFLADWQARAEPVGFMLYDAPPALPAGAPVFIHADKAIRVQARIAGTEFVAGHRFTCAPDERAEACEDIWRRYRAGTAGAETREEFAAFFEHQHGVRAVLILDNLSPVNPPLPFKAYSRVLDWGYPTGVGYRLLAPWQTHALQRACAPSDTAPRPRDT